MPEMKIARFIGIEACKSVFSEHSTFVLRSPEHYRRLCETTNGTDTKGDDNEGIAEKIGGGTAEFTGFLASCWTMLEGSEPTRDEWDIFKEDEQNLVAIVTTPSSVYEFLKTALQIDRGYAQRRFPFLSLKHGKVCYEKQNVDRTNIFDIVPFTKDGKFRKQREYRFVLDYAWMHVIDSLVFCAGIADMGKCGDDRLSNFANPEMSQQDRERLLLILMSASAGYADFAGKSISEIVANADLLFV
jgi:hypothetical protein